MDVTQVEAAITPNTKAIFAVNLLGNPNDFDVLNSICKKHNLILLEDNCESMGAFYKGKSAGTIGEMGTFSTFYSHHLCTMEGGVTVTDNEELYHYMLSIRAHGWTRNLPKDSKIYKKKEDAFYESFNFIMPGYNLRPIEMEGALGIEQLKKLDDIIAQRRENAKYFKSQINDLEGYRFQEETEDSSWFGFAIILEGKNIGKRSQLVKLLDQNNIDARPVVAGNFVRNKAVEYLDYSVHNTLKNADYIHDEAFFVGNHSKDNKEHVDRLISCLKSFSNA